MIKGSKMPNKLQVPDHLIIDSLETLKVLSDPTRLEIMKYIGQAINAAR
jgi:hypothetical protein